MSGPVVPRLSGSDGLTRITHSREGWLGFRFSYVEGYFKACEMYVLGVHVVLLTSVIIVHMCSDVCCSRASPLRVCDCLYVGGTEEGRDRASVRGRSKSERASKFV